MSSAPTDGGRGVDQPEHSHLCCCQACMPMNRGALERLVASFDGWVNELDELDERRTR